MHNGINKESKDFRIFVLNKILINKKLIVILIKVAKGSDIKVLEKKAESEAKIIYIIFTFLLVVILKIVVNNSIFTKASTKNKGNPIRVTKVALGVVKAVQIV